MKVWCVSICLITKQSVDTVVMDGLAFHEQVLPQLPPGFRFHPTDEELLIHYLKKKVSSSPIPGSIIAEIDLYKHDPWDLPAKACFGEQEWYFFSPRDRKYPNGERPNRSAGSGYWKATGTDKPIVITSGSTSSQKVGVKKSLVFYKGRPLKGLKTNWIMHEYRLAETLPTKRKGSLRLDDWVLCRIYKKVSHSPRVVSCPELEPPSPSPSATDVQRTRQKSAMPKFGSFSRLLQSEGPSMEDFLSRATSDANAALSHVEPSSTLQVVPQKLNSSETRSHLSMTMGFNGDEVSSVHPAKRQNTLNPSSSLQLQSSNPYMAVSVPDQHMYRLPINESWNPETPTWPLPAGNLWPAYDNG